MIQSPHTKLTGTFKKCWLGRLSLLKVAIVLIGLISTHSAVAQTAPTIVSVTPANGATGVATNSTIVFVFDQPMRATTLPLPTSAFFVGNFEILPFTVTFTGALSADRRTLTLTPSVRLPTDTTINWRLNQPSAILPFANATGQLLATVSGSFTTVAGPPRPTIVSVSPANGNTNVSPSVPLTFHFDQDMDTSVSPALSIGTLFIGNYNITPSGIALFNSAWSADKRSLTFTPSFPVRLGATLSWTLNPSAASTVPFKNLTGQTLATTNGSYTIMVNTGGSTNELCTPTGTPPNLGTYLLSKRVSHHQSGAAQVVVNPDQRPVFQALAQGPIFGGAAVTNGSLTLPGGTTRNFTNAGVSLGIFGSFTNEAAMEESFPLGAYTLRFTRAGLPESAVPMNVPALPVSVPTIANWQEAQTVNASGEFTFRWNALTPQSPGAVVSFAISDEIGNLIFVTPNGCIPRTIAPTDTSVTIPAGYFRPGLKYRGSLSFGYIFYNSTNDVPQMGGSGSVLRTTSFEFQTTGDGTGTGGGNVPPPAAAARFTAFRLLANGHPELTLTGTASRSYTLQRKGNILATIWTTAGTVTMNAAGSAVFEDTASPLVFPVFYRAMGN